MNRKLLQLLGVLLVTTSASFAGLNDVEIKVDRQKLDETKTRQGGPVTVVTKEIVYTLTIQNRTFKPLKDLVVKYVIYYQDAQGGSTEKPVEVPFSGSDNIPSIEGNRSVLLITKPLKLSKEELDGGWVYASGASGRARDRVTGVWVKVFSEGQEVGQYANPSSLTKRQVWKD